ncbi:small ribosomal subunit protein mS39 [Austrofundulus limnaeus]|uniref:Small ribosomal subunit protein mS39 n=1 Tax=Austrofundulus limnaeus TaxID=52670 RepID=A0A2I4CXH1_AUSLI|nr:PREDICTED: pentatricopeptide repeat domain-containing protein 3, mitochondrial [Austrofundulus limnaeus]
MAASCMHIGRYIRRNERFLRLQFEQFLSIRSFALTPAVHQAAQVHQEAAESVVIPMKKTWSKEAVLQALASTVSRDPTVCAYRFQDDSFLSPRNFSEAKTYSYSLESGRAAAKYIINNNPNLFTKDFAEPHIPCLMPEKVSPLLEEVSEAALKERINLRKVTAAVDMYDQLLQAGSVVSMDTTHDLLDLLCLYGDSDPVQESGPQQEDTEESEQELWSETRIKKPSWRKTNNAERIFNLLPDRDTRCYSALIRGMVKHGASKKAFDMYSELLNNRLTGDVHMFNALISAVPDVRENPDEKWELVSELLKQMNQMSIRPNLLTFNSLFKTLKRCGKLSTIYAPLALNEMKALGIAPSLATYNHLLHMNVHGFLKIQVLRNLLLELEGCSFTCRDPGDNLFFGTAMKACLINNDLELGYKVHSLLEVGENWRLLGAANKQAYYYNCFLRLLCQMENIDVVLKWYKKLVPSMFYPHPENMMGMLQTLDTENRLDLLPMIWKDMKTFGHIYPDLVEELLSLMARDKHNPKVQESFAACALDVKQTFSEKGIEWKSSYLSHVSTVLLRANQCEEAWEMLLIFKEKNLVPSEAVLNSFLSECQSSIGPDRAVELVQLSAAFCLPATSELASRVLVDFNLTESQRTILSQLQTAEKMSD